MIIYMIKNTLDRFRKDDDGIALTEYLILLGLLTAGVIVAVGFFGDNLSTLWNDWADWSSEVLEGPDGTISGG